MLRVLLPDCCDSESRYITKIILNDFWGIAYDVKIHSEQTICIEAEGARIEIPSTFFSVAEKKWLKPESLPVQPLEYYDTRELGLEINLTDAIVPVIYGLPSCNIERRRIRLGLDIPGSVFFMLSRYEEAVKQDRDEHRRFPAKASLAYQQDFLDRPIVNEYVEILWACMKHLWPALERKRREFRTMVSADVDFPYSYGSKNFNLMLRQFGGDIINRRNPVLAIHNVLNYGRAKQGDFSSDPLLRNFEWMMDVNEAAGNRVAFYFITDHTDPGKDGYYSIHEPVIRTLIRSIHKRGHEIGLHASYNSLQDEAQTRKEVDILRKVMEEEGVKQDCIGSRQHFLRWETPATAQHLEAAGLTYDTTLSFAGYAGFRCGTCYEYPFYDVIKRQALKLIERPLIVMEKSVFDNGYIGKSAGKDGQAVFENFKLLCRKFSGDFSVLWHNNQFPNRQAREIYKTVIH